jgi:hypothetical protein
MNYNYAQTNFKKLLHLIFCNFFFSRALQVVLYEVKWCFAQIFPILLKRTREYNNQIK